jgi:DNA-binding NtrC family response regulator
MDLLSRDPPDVVLFSLSDGQNRRSFDALIEYINQRFKHLPVLAVADGCSAETTLHALRAGAVDCLSRPLNLGRLVFLLRVLTLRSRPAEASQRVEESPQAGEDFVTESIEMRRLLDAIRMSARLDSTVLFTGETGTGKNHLARFVHQISPRRFQPFVTFDCGASSLTLMEDELFGHERGAFTGADRPHVGKLERAQHGTLLIDEVDALPSACQTRLLTAIEERVFERLGAERGRVVDARIVVASNQSLEEEVEAGRFRRDLYYRLNVIAFHVPPLRQRREDIAPLARYLLDRFNRRNGINVNGISEEAICVLRNYSWPGNIRELRNEIERAGTLTAGSEIEPQHLSPRLSSQTTAETGVAGKRLSDVRLEAERRELLEVLRQNDGNRTRAAKQLGISRAAFYKRLRKTGVQ